MIKCAHLKKSCTPLMHKDTLSRRPIYEAQYLGYLLCDDQRDDVKISKKIRSLDSL